MIHAEHTPYPRVGDRDFLFEFSQNRGLNAFAFLNGATGQILSVGVSMSNKRCAIMLVKKHNSDTDGSRLRHAPDEVRCLPD